MCIDGGCDELLCCLCAPLAALFCCKLCKDRMDSNNDVSQAPDSAFYQPPDGRVPVIGVYDLQGHRPPVHSQVKFYPGGPQPYYPPPRPTFQQQYYLQYQDCTHHDLPGAYVKQQPRPYQ